MKTINILVTDGAIGSAVMAILDMVGDSNQFWKMLHPASTEPLLKAEIYSNTGEQFTCSNGIVLAAKPLEQYKAADAVIVSSFYAFDKKSLDYFLTQTASLGPVVQQEHARGALVASFCSGTFALAATGLLDNRHSTTVWWMKNLFRNHFPSIELRLDDLVVECGTIITGGATTSIHNVLLRVIEKLVDPHFSAQLAKIFLIDRNRLSQLAFMDPNFIINSADAVVDEIQTWMVQNYEGSISLDDICEQFAITKRTLNRRFKASSGETPLNFLQRVRIEQAKHYLETTNLPIERVVEKVGYEDPASFRKLFSAQTQLTPKAYRQRFGYRVQVG